MTSRVCPECSSLPSAPHAPRCYRGRVEAAERRGREIVLDERAVKRLRKQLDALDVECAGLDALVNGE